MRLQKGEWYKCISNLHISYHVAASPQLASFGFRSGQAEKIRGGADVYAIAGITAIYYVKN